MAENWNPAVNFLREKRGRERESRRDRETYTYSRTGMISFVGTCNLYDYLIKFSCTVMKDATLEEVYHPLFIIIEEEVNDQYRNW